MVFQTDIFTHKSGDDVSYVEVGQAIGIVGKWFRKVYNRTHIASSYSEGSVSFLVKNSGLNRRAMLPYRVNCKWSFKIHFLHNPRMSVADVIGEGIRVHEVVKVKSTQKYTVMNDVGLAPEMRFRYPNELSGGQRQEWLLRER